MGHRSIITTMAYTQVTHKRLTSIKSPLDLLDIPKNGHEEALHAVCPEG
jgi:hypothetical protein